MVGKGRGVLALEEGYLQGWDSNLLNLHNLIENYANLRNLIYLDVEFLRDSVRALKVSMR